MTQMPQVWCEIAFTTDAGDGSPLWVDVSPYVEWQLGVRIARRRSHELDQVGPGTMNLLLLNDGRFTVANSSSPYYPYVLINRPIRVRSRWPVSANLLQPGQAAGVDVALFSATTGALAADVGVVPAGQTSSIRWTATLSNGDFLRVGAASTSSPTDQATPVQSGLTYSLQFQARRGATGNATVAAMLRWYDISGNQLGDSVGTPVSLTTTFQTVSLSAAAPAGAVSVRAVLKSTAASGGSVQVYVGAWQLEQAAAPSAWAAAGTDSIRYRGVVDQWPIRWQNGVLAQSSINCTDRMKLISRARLSTTLTDNQKSGARIVALLADVGITDVDRIDPGLSVLRLTGNEADQPILQLIRQVEISEAGLFFIRRDGKPAFHDRARRQTPAVTVLTLAGDQVGPDLSFLVDDALLMNDVTVTGYDGSTSHQVLGSTSIGLYGRYSRSIDTLLPTGTTDLANRANYLFNVYSDPKPRAGQITIEIRSQPGLWPNLLALEIGDRVQVTSLPAEAPTPVLDLWVEGIAETITDQSWTVTLDPSPASATTAFILDDPVYGVLNTNTLGW
ncbi:hypothetical protein ACQPYK_08545 [Streptosporangium sp. CA-135522]|uniref:hypothetical protein n=1 Tax=Streptosporangium sp. CA-135522 TaxID=3240072 RepID=UPI003D89D24A